MRFASLGSGSEGNGLLVEAGGSRVLIDCGFGIRDTVARLSRLGVAPDTVSAIIVTHEHSDHIGGVAAFATRFGTPVWLTFGTLSVPTGKLTPGPHLLEVEFAASDHGPFNPRVIERVTVTAKA